MQVKIWVLSVANSDLGDEPCRPAVFTSEEEADAEADKRLRAAWKEAPAMNEEGDALSYPGDWRLADRLLGKEWGYEHVRHEITEHEFNLILQYSVVAVRKMIDSAEGAPAMLTDGLMRVALKRIEDRVDGKWYNPPGDLESDIRAVVRDVKAKLETTGKPL